MKTFPLESITIEQAMQKQFHFVDCMMKYFSGAQSLTRGDLGVHQPENQPLTTRKAEKVIADFFGSEDCILVRGSGTGAIRYGLSSMQACGTKILVHDAAIYSTTVTSFEMFGLIPIRANFNDLNDIKKVLTEDEDIKGALVQYTRQKPYDSYDIQEVIQTITNCKDIPILTDDNYAVMKVQKIGCEMGADISCFSTFKLQGPEGIGCVVGKKKYIDKIRKMHYSGGCQVQGWEAMEVLRGLTYAPVLLAITAKTANEVLDRIQNGEVPGIKDAYIANAQSKVLLVEFEEPIAKQVLKIAETKGTLPNPVGAESKYEIAPLFYRVSGTFLKTDPTLASRVIRINPNRAGADTIINILKECLVEIAQKESRD